MNVYQTKCINADAEFHLRVVYLVLENGSKR